MQNMNAAYVGMYIQRVVQCTSPTGETGCSTSHSVLGTAIVALGLGWRRTSHTRTAKRTDQAQCVVQKFLHTLLSVATLYDCV